MRAKFIYLDSFDFCMCNTAYDMKAVLFPLVCLNFGCPFAVTACTHSNMSLKCGGGGGGTSAPQVSPLPTPLSCNLVMNSIHSMHVYVYVSEWHYLIGRCGSMHPRKYCKIKCPDIPSRLILSQTTTRIISFSGL